MRSAHASPGAGFDLDAVTEADLEEPPRPEPLYDLADLDDLLRRGDLLPPGVDVHGLAPHEHRYQAPGMREEVRITTKREYYDDHPLSLELWSPGNPLFPVPEGVASEEEVVEVGGRLRAVMGAAQAGAAEPARITSKDRRT